MPRFVAMVRATERSETGQLPTQGELEAMGKYTEELVKNGVMLAGEGLHPSSRGARVRFTDSSRAVIDGPFSETKELIAGFWILQARSLDEAVEWIKRAPNPFPGEIGEVEIRQVYEVEDFGVELTPELREQEERRRAQFAKS